MATVTITITDTPAPEGATDDTPIMAISFTSDPPMKLEPNPDGTYELTNAQEAAIFLSEALAERYGEHAPQDLDSESHASGTAGLKDA